jgi:hypothetical protein
MMNAPVNVFLWGDIGRARRCCAAKWQAPLSGGAVRRISFAQKNLRRATRREADQPVLLPMIN